MTNFAKTIESEIDARAQYERDKNASNDTIQTTLKNIKSNATHDRIAAIMQAAKYDASVINRAERSNARTNVYALEKHVNIAQAIAKVRALNHYTRAILKAAIALEKKDKRLTHDAAQSACSLDVKAKDSKIETLIRACKYQKHVAKSTASTQASSSLSALCSMNVLTASRDASNSVIYSVADNDTAKQVCELV